METIVVGVDGSDNGARALRWALRHAGGDGARVIAVHAWGVSAFAYGGPGFVATVDPAEFEHVARAALEETVAGLAGELPEGVQVEQRVLEGGAAGVLVAL